MQVFEHICDRRGKLMRPILVFLSARLLGEVNRNTYDAALALELLHTASLMHDDVVDEANQRRGKASVRAAFQNKVAVLSGDYLLAASLSAAARTNSNDIITLIAHLGQRISDGELQQLHNVLNSIVSEADYFEVINKKTAALFEACAMTGAYSVNAEANVVNTLARIGNLIGLCFQLRDDIFDYFPLSETGKPTASDIREGKLTLPAIYVYHKAKSEMEMLVKRIKMREADEADIQTMLTYSINNGGIDYAEQQMDKIKEEAKTLLFGFPKSIIRDSLEAYIDYVSERKY
jgi:octaprenyl-diphosphate synthase